MKKRFIITVDTEGDDLWNYHQGDIIRTENTLYIPRFQELCEKYRLKPVYLTNYEVINDNRFVNYVKAKIETGKCEVGIHVHAWNNPPFYSLNDKYGGNPYLVEYPDKVMRDKFEVTFNLIREKLGINVLSHRAGRWAMDDRYFKLLAQYGIKVDCSYTPFVSWNDCPGSTISGGADYRNIPLQPFYKGTVLEVPMTIRRFFHIPTGSFKYKIKASLKRPPVWLRPSTSSVSMMKIILSKILNEPTDYAEFMIHSSELMPSGSPYYKSEDAIESLYKAIDEVFNYAIENNFEGCTLSEYYDIINKKRC